MSSQIQIFKFGGASVKDATAVRNVASVLKSYAGKQTVLILSAMGKTTNALERIHQSYLSGSNKDAIQRIAELKNYHSSILDELFTDKNHIVFREFNQLFGELAKAIDEKPELSYDKSYDRLVHFGERIATTILNAYLQENGFETQHIEAGDFIATDNNYRDAYVDWDLTVNKISEGARSWFANEKPCIVITQGFIAKSAENAPITLGREGSDFSASIFAYSLNATEMVIWKDVPGVMNADPKLMPEAVTLEHISYREAVELAYYGASVIHPKTIKPLENKNIPLRVKSFLNPVGEGTLIDRVGTDDKKVASYIFKFNQVLLSLFPRDFSFINEKNISEIFSLFSRNNIKVRLMQNSAISFSVCFDYEPARLNVLLEDLSKLYSVRYNEQVELVTIRHYSGINSDSIISGRKILLEQKSRSTWQIILNKQ